MRQRNLFTSDLLDLHDEPAGTNLRRACQVTAARENPDGSVTLSVPFETVPKLRDEPGYEPAGVSRIDCRVTLTAYGPEILRLTLAPKGFEPELKSPMLDLDDSLKVLPLSIVETEHGWSIHDEAGRRRAAIDNTPPALSEWTGKHREVIDALNLTLYPDGGTPVPVNSADRFDDYTYDSMPLCLVERDGKVIRSGFALSADLDESFYGTGERFAKLDLSGRTIDLSNTDGLGTNSRRAYKNIPLFLSSRPYGCFIHTSAEARLSLADISTRSAAGMVPEPALDLFIIGGESLERILLSYRRLTGFPAMPPAWSFGMWMSRMTYFSAEEVRGIAKRLRDERYPCDVLHLDTGWFEKDWVCEWKFSPERFPDHPGFMQEMREQGFRISLWQTPYLSKDNCRLEEAKAGGYIGKMKAGSGEASGSDFSEESIGGHIDFSNPAAVAWYQGLLRELLNDGASAIKTDFGEDITDAEYAIPLQRLHNLYPLLYQQAAYDVTREVTGDSIIWARAGWAGCQRYPVHWGGDAECSWAGLAGSLRGGLQLGLSGFAFWSHDVPGFHGTPQFMHSLPAEDLYLRWTQFGVFTSHLRYHGTSPREPWEFPAVADSVRRWLNLRYALIPYLLREGKAAIESGLPLLAALVLHHGDDPVCRGIDDQFYCGRDFLIAPVMNSEGVRDVYLPRGEWVDLWTGEVRRGPGWLRRLHVPLSLMPVFVKKGASIPVYPQQVQSTAEMDMGKVTEIRFDEGYKGLEGVLGL